MRLPQPMWRGAPHPTPCPRQCATPGCWTARKRTHAFAAADVAGRTDTYIVSTALRDAGLQDSPEAHRRFRDAYVPLLEEEICRPSTGRTGVMPGIVHLLERLGQGDGFHVALLTGNF